MNRKKEFYRTPLYVAVARRYLYRQNYLFIRISSTLPYPFWSDLGRGGTRTFPPPSRTDCCEHALSTRWFLHAFLPISTFHHAVRPHTTGKSHRRSITVLSRPSGNINVLCPLPLRVCLRGGVSYECEDHFQVNLISVGSGNRRCSNPWTTCKSVSEEPVAMGLAEINMSCRPPRCSHPRGWQHPSLLLRLLQRRLPPSKSPWGVR